MTENKLITKKAHSSLRKTPSQLLQSPGPPVPAQGLLTLAEEQVDREATLQPWLLRTL